MGFDEGLAARIRQYLTYRTKVEERKMFGCIAFLAGGHAVVGVWKRSLIVRVGTDHYEGALLEPHVREFDITGKPMRGWVVVGPGGVEEDGQLTAWITRFLSHMPFWSSSMGYMLLLEFLGSGMTDLQLSKSDKSIYNSALYFNATKKILLPTSKFHIAETDKWRKGWLGK